MGKRLNNTHFYATSKKKTEKEKAGADNLSLANLGT